MRTIFICYFKFICVEPFAGRSMADCLLPAGQAWYGRKLHASVPVRLHSYCSKHLWCEQPVKEIQLTSICYVQICAYSSFYGDFLRWIDRRSAAFTFRSWYLCLLLLVRQMEIPVSPMKVAVHRRSLRLSYSLRATEVWSGQIPFLSGS